MGILFAKIWSLFTNEAGGLTTKHHSPTRWSIASLGNRGPTLSGQKFPGRWVGRNGPIPWPPRSPDLIPLKFFFWGCSKDQIYKQKVQTIQDLKMRIMNAVNSVTEEMLQNRWQELEYRLMLFALLAEPMWKSGNQNMSGK